MRRFLAGLLAILMVVCFSGCGSEGGGQNVNSSDIGDDVSEVGDGADLQNEADALMSSEAALPEGIIPDAPGTKTEENDDMIIDYSNAEQGYIMVQYKTDSTVKIKAQVTGESETTYTYNLTPQEWAAFPLSDGNGSYKVCVFENVSGNSYATVGSVSFDVELNDPNAPFITSNQYVNFDGKTKCVRMAQVLCQDLTEEMDKVKAVYNWTLEHFEYDTAKAKSVNSGYLPDLDEVYDAKKGICFDYAATMVAMLRSQEVPTKLVIGYSDSAYHAWINVYTKDSGWVTGAIYFDGSDWNLMDPTFADSADSSEEVMEYIGNGSNYSAKYIY